MKKIFKIICLLASFCLILGALVFFQSNNVLSICFFDVGQGDAVFIRTPEGHNILIDGGPDKAILAKLGQALPFYDRTIDLMVLTHPHADHVTGLIEVLRRYQVKQVLATGVIYLTPDYTVWLEEILKQRLPFITAVAGQRFIFGQTPNKFTGQTEMTILFPEQSLFKQEFIKNSDGEVNDSSVAVKFTFLDSQILLTGDLETAGEQALVKKWGTALQADLLKAGHHGSDTSSSQLFLNQVMPKIAVFQLAADNHYGLPSPRVLNRLKKLGTAVFRNDLDGDVCLQTNSTGFSGK